MNPGIKALQVLSNLSESCLNSKRIQIACDNLTACRVLQSNLLNDFFFFIYYDCPKISVYLL